MTQEALIDELKTRGVLRSPRIEEALRRVDRADFVLPEYRTRAYDDTALPIVGGQTISQPLTAVFMLEQLEAEEGGSVLEIGLGSGWQAALLAELVGPAGRVISVEYLPEVFSFAEENLEDYDLPQLEIRQGDASAGWAEGAPYDRIIGAAAGEEVPRELPRQLAPHGRLIMPVGHCIVLMEKDERGLFRRREFPGFSFVPLRGKRGWR